MSMSIDQRNNVISNTMEQIFEPQAIAKTAIQCGFNIESSFQPKEFLRFCQKVERIALKQIRENLENQGLGNPDQDEALQQTISPWVEKNLRAICHCSKKDLLFPEPSTTLFDWIASWIWK